MAHQLETHFKYCFMHTFSHAEETAGYIHNALRRGNESVSQRLQSLQTVTLQPFKSQFYCIF